MKIPGKDCVNIPKHKFQVCEECVDKGDSLTKHFKCKYCTNKTIKEYATLNIVQNFIEDLTIPLLKVVSSKMTKDNLELDD